MPESQQKPQGAYVAKIAAKLHKIVTTSPMLPYACLDKGLLKMAAELLDAYAELIATIDALKAERGQLTDDLFQTCVKAHNDQERLKKRIPRRVVRQ